MRMFNPGGPKPEQPRDGSTPHRETINGKPAIRVPQYVAGYDKDGFPLPRRLEEFPEGAAAMALPPYYQIIRQGESITLPADLRPDVVRACIPWMVLETEAPANEPASSSSDPKPADVKSKPGK